MPDVLKFVDSGGGLLPNTYDIGDVVTLSETFTNASGQNVDPTDVILYIGSPLATPTTVQTFKLSLSQVIRDSAGQYHMDFTPPTHGWWEYQWQGTGTAPGSSPVAKFYVRPSFAIAG